MRDREKERWRSGQSVVASQVPLSCLTQCQPGSSHTYNNYIRILSGIMPDGDCKCGIMYLMCDIHNLMDIRFQRDKTVK